MITMKYTSVCSQLQKQFTTLLGAGNRATPFLNKDFTDLISQFKLDNRKQVIVQLQSLGSQIEAEKLLVSREIVKLESLIEQFKSLGFGNKNKAPLAENDCLWVPAMINSNSNLVYGGCNYVFDVKRL